MATWQASTFREQASIALAARPALEQPLSQPCPAHGTNPRHALAVFVCFPPILYVVGFPLWLRRFLLGNRARSAYSRVKCSSYFTGAHGLGDEEMEQEMRWACSIPCISKAPVTISHTS